MDKNNKVGTLTVIVRNSSGTRIRYPDGRVEGYVSISAERHSIAVEGINRMRRESITTLNSNKEVHHDQTTMASTG